LPWWLNTSESPDNVSVRDGEPLDERHHAGPNSRRQLGPGGHDRSQAGVGVAQPADEFGLLGFRQPAEGFDDRFQVVGGCLLGRFVIVGRVVFNARGFVAGGLFVAVQVEPRRVECPAAFNRLATA